jgi:hypothetical protein
MTTKSSRELGFKKSSEPIPTVEIDTDIPEDALTWSTVESQAEYDGHSPRTVDEDDGNMVDTVIGETEEELPGDDELDLKGFRIESPARYRAARADASIASIKRQIESVFGLPEGSVALCGPDGRPLRSDARIATLRRRWE